MRLGAVWDEAEGGSRRVDGEAQKSTTGVMSGRWDTKQRDRGDDTNEGAVALEKARRG